jgi:GNAT superfamily N-acetyltransferase
VNEPPAIVSADQNCTTTSAALPQLSVRKASRADAPVLARHRAEMFRDMGELDARVYDRLLVASRRYFETALPAGEYHGWLAAVADRPGEIVAGAGVQLRPMLPRPPRGGEEITLGPEALVLNVFTERPWRRRGAAALLMRHVLEWARLSGISRVVLHASPDGRSLYERLGFVPTNEMRLSGR